MDKRRAACEEGRAEGLEAGIRQAIIALRGAVAPGLIAERFKMSVEQMVDISK